MASCGLAAFGVKELRSGWRSNPVLLDILEGFGQSSQCSSGLCGLVLNDVDAGLELFPIGWLPSALAGASGWR